MILNCVYIWKLCFGHFSQSQHSKLAPAADIEKKRHCQFPSRCRMLSTIWFSRWLFLNKILEAVNPNFNCLILYVWWCVPGGVSYTVNLMHIGPKFGKIQPIQCALRNKIARVCFSIIFFFFAFWTKHIFRIIATAAWIIKAIIKLYSDYAVFKFDGSMLKSCRFTRLQECLVAIVCHFGLHTGHQVAHLIYA